MKIKSLARFAKMCPVFLLVSSYACFGQKGFNAEAITNEGLKELVKSCKTITYPFEFSDPPNNGEIKKELLVGVSGVVDKDDLEEARYETYYAGYVFYEDNYLGVIVSLHYSPGAFGIDNEFVELITFAYDGSLIEQKEIGCFCWDSDLGINEFHASEIEVIVDSTQITTYWKYTYGTLSKEDSENPFEEITHDTTYININKHGRCLDMFRLASQCDDKSLRDALQDDFNVNIWNGVGQPPIYIACEKGCLETVKLLIEFGADVNVREVNHPSSLHVASEKGWVDIVELLIEHGADLECMGYGGNGGRTPLDFAKNEEVREILRRAGGMTGEELR